MSNTSALQALLETPDGELVEVGYLYNDNERNWFQFSDSYWGLPNRPVLGQTFEEHGRSWRPSAHVALPSWFSHLLPEGRLRTAVAAAAETDRAREFNLLARIGVDDLPGALRIGEPRALRDVKVPPELVAAEHEEGNPLLKYSLAGTQLKFSIYRGSKGLTVPAKGQAGNVIVKLPDGRPGFSGVPEAELASLHLADASGINTPRAQLVSISEITGLEEWAEEIADAALSVDRFDRHGDRRIHMEELAQVLNIPAAVENAKYLRANFETVATLIGGLCGPDAVGEVIARIVLNVLLGNGDAHLKNWAVLYGDGTRPSLSPIYDILPTVLYIPNDDLGLKLAGSRAFADVRIESFDAIGVRTEFGVANARMAAKEAVDRVLHNWESLNPALSAESYKKLTARLRTLGLRKTS